MAGGGKTPACRIPSKREKKISGELSKNQGVSPRRGLNVIPRRPLTRKGRKGFREKEKGWSTTACREGGGEECESNKVVPWGQK